jgi:hypothetical protein
MFLIQKIVLIFIYFFAISKISIYNFSVLALKELTEYEHQYGGIAGGMYPQMAQGFPAQPTHINYQQMAQETVIMEVAQGMQIQLPNADGTNSTYFGPYRNNSEIYYLYSKCIIH